MIEYRTRMQDGVEVIHIVVVEAVIGHGVLLVSFHIRTNKELEKPPRVSRLSENFSARRTQISRILGGTRI
jgi:hypothetical protein